MKLQYIAFAFACFMSETFARQQIKTIPPTPDDVLATDYSGLVVRAVFQKTSATTNCEWRYNEEKNGAGFEYKNVQFLIGGVGCYNRTTGRLAITCVEREISGFTHIITNLTYLQPLTADLDLAVTCNNGQNVIEALPRKQVQDCSKTLQSSVYVDTATHRYESEGEFRCHGSALVLYSNGSQPTNLQTSCLYTAEWKGHESLVCWEAPEPQLIGSVTVLEGKNVELRCEYEDVVPFGESSIFYFDGAGYTINKNHNFTITSLQAADDSKQVSCQAVTPYTQIYNASGRSPSRNINVLYLSKSRPKLLLSGRLLLSTGEEFFLRFGEEISLNCSTSGNLIPKCKFTLCNDTCQNLPNEGDNCQIRHFLEESGSLNCEIFNVLVPLKSQKRNVSIVPENREVELRHHEKCIGGKQLTFEREEQISLRCSIDYGNEINSSYTWMHPNGNELSGSDIVISSLNLFDIGKYTCFAKDLFGEFNNTVYINITSGPFHQKNVTCTWVTDEPGYCNISFLSNPKAIFLNLTKDGFLVDGVIQGKRKNFLQDLYYIKNPVTESDGGKYEMNVRSPLYGENQTIVFEIKVVAEPILLSQLTIKYYICLGTAAALAMVILILSICILVNKSRRRKSILIESSNENSTRIIEDCCAEESGYLDMQSTLKRQPSSKKDTLLKSSCAEKNKQKENQTNIFEKEQGLVENKHDTPPEMKVRYDNLCHPFPNEDKAFGESENDFSPEVKVRYGNLSTNSGNEETAIPEAEPNFSPEMKVVYDEVCQSKPQQGKSDSKKKKAKKKKLQRPLNSENQNCYESMS